MRVNLTDIFVKSAKPGDYFDAHVAGLQVRVAPTGLKTWSVMFTSPRNNKRARLKIGRYPTTSLAEARTKALEAHALVEKGTDPRDAMAPAESADDGEMTVAMLVEEYIAKHAIALRSGDSIARSLRNDVVPVIGSLKLSVLHRRDVHRMLDPIRDRGSPVSVRRRFDEFRAMLRWGLSRGYLDTNPMEAMAPPPGWKTRTRVLDDDEIKALWGALPHAFPASAALALKLSLVTGQRIGECGGICLSEIDFHKRVWRLPAERVKNASEHMVPLSDLAMEIIEEARPGAKGDRLFSMPVVHISRLVSERRQYVGLPHWTAHDLRRTACTGMARLGVSPLVIGHCVNHLSTTRAGQTLATYVHYDFGREKREALDLWASHLRGLIRRGAKVLPLMRADAK